MKSTSSVIAAPVLERSNQRESHRALVLAGALCAAFAARAGEVEVLHFWTSPGETQSIAEPKSLIAVRVDRLLAAAAAAPTATAKRK
jgi:hypothetical protein